MHSNATTFRCIIFNIAFIKISQKQKQNTHIPLKVFFSFRVLCSSSTTTTTTINTFHVHAYIHSWYVVVHVCMYVIQ